MSNGPRAHILARRGQGHAMAARAAAQPPTTQRLAGQRPAGSTQHFAVFSDGSSQGDASAQAVLQRCEADFAAMTAWFGGLSLPPGQEGDDQTTVRTALPLQVAMDAQAGGAYHYSCAGTDIFIEPDPAAAAELVVAEVVEVFEAAQGKGWQCGQTNGEGLSRVLAGERYAALGQDFAQTAQAWWGGGHQDYVTDNSATDQDEAGNGCATLFLYYLRGQLGYSWQQIVAAGASTLGGTYQQLTGKAGSAGFADFVAAVGTLDAGGGQLRLPASGNPFPLAGATAGSGAPAGGGSTVPAGGSTSGGSASGGGPGVGIALALVGVLLAALAVVQHVVGLVAISHAALYLGVVGVVLLLAGIFMVSRGQG